MLNPLFLDDEDAMNTITYRNLRIELQREEKYEQINFQRHEFNNMDIKGDFLSVHIKKTTTTISTRKEIIDEMYSHMLSSWISYMHLC